MLEGTYAEIGQGMLERGHLKRCAEAEAPIQPGRRVPEPVGVHTSAYASIRQHTSEYVSIRQRT